MINRVFLHLLFVFLCAACSSPELRPAWMENSDEFSIAGYQPYNETLTAEEKFFYLPSADADTTVTPKEAPIEIPDFRGEQTPSVNQILYDVKNIIALRPELIEAITSIEEKSAAINENRSSFFPKIDGGLINDEVLFENTNSSRKTTGGYVDAYVDLNYMISDFGGRNAKFYRAIKEKELAILQFQRTVNKQAEKFMAIYLEYALTKEKQAYLEEYQSELLRFRDEAEERLSGGVATIFEGNAIEQAIMRLEIKKSVAKQELERVKSEFLSYFASDLNDDFKVEPADFLELINAALDKNIDKIFLRKSPFLEERIFEVQADIANWDYKQAISSVSPSTNLRLRGKAFDIDRGEIDNYEFVLTLQGSLGIFDGGSSNSKAIAAYKRGQGARERERAIKVNNDARLNTLNGLIGSLFQRLDEIQELINGYEGDLAVAEIKSENVRYSPNEIIGARERILEQQLARIDNRVSQSRLLTELMSIHGLYADILGLGASRPSDVTGNLASVDSQRGVQPNLRIVSGEAAPSLSSLAASATANQVTSSSENGTSHSSLSNETSLPSKRDLSLVNVMTNANKPPNSSKEIELPSNTFELNSDNKAGSMTFVIQALDVDPQAATTDNLQSKVRFDEGLEDLAIKRVDRDKSYSGHSDSGLAFDLNTNEVTKLNDKVTYAGPPTPSMSGSTKQIEALGWKLEAFD